MRLSSIARYLELAGVGAEEYSLGARTEDRWCLLPVPGHGWEVFYAEHGGRGARELFGTETGACYYLYGRLVEQHVMTGRLVVRPS
ncbi:hypothetical protein GCM10010174_54190 [Kutzneria viridogrisea]|uniref:Uncharacterized protein n=2 Tax=Kutzneria TaxID=43356 RepID=W5W0E5_9PSEU|nr:hypothetical protein [Kutzneria albida]AHH94633.1 hypothetical protein KALB_1260 [Kutzneria albida DSM 43870]MBA8930301.1 hypothetical protein [Kutzneria viridogrisea]